MAETSVSKIDAAVDQLDWAIRLFLDNKAYLPAITLAAAAEEILGQVVDDRAAFKLLKGTLAGMSGLEEKIVSKGHLNKAKNWLKHWGELKDEETISLEWDQEPIQYIVRALTNLATHDGSQPSQAPRFWKWLEELRPEYFAEP